MLMQLSVAGLLRDTWLTIARKNSAWFHLTSWNGTGHRQISVMIYPKTRVLGGLLLWPEMRPQRISATCQSGAKSGTAVAPLLQFWWSCAESSKSPLIWPNVADMVLFPAATESASALNLARMHQNRPNYPFDIHWLFAARLFTLRVHWHKKCGQCETRFVSDNIMAKSWITMLWQKRFFRPLSALRGLRDFPSALRMYQKPARWIRSCPKVPSADSCAF